MTTTLLEMRRQDGRLCRHTLAVAAFCLAVLPWQAARADHSLSAGAQACQVDRYQSTYCDSDSGSSVDGPLRFHASLGPAQATVSLDYGVFKGSADLSVTSAGVLIPRHLNVDSTARGSATDTWRITGGTGKGYLQLTWTVDGAASSFSRSASSPAAGMYDDAFLTMDVHIRATTPAGAIVATELTTGAVREAGVYKLPGRAAFDFDSPINVVFTGTVAALLGTNVQFTGPSFQGEAHADFSHTALLTGVAVYDANGLLLRDARIMAESGTMYPLAAVPEASTSALLLLGLCMLAARQRRQPASARRPGGSRAAVRLQATSMDAS